ncbi:MAG: KEOPS complex subunit Pcc1 [Thermoplasmatota archaeon]
MHTASIVIRHRHAALLCAAVGRERVPRADVEISCSGDELRLTVTADNAAHLRAACNSFLEWIHLAEQIGRLTGTER